MCPHEYGFSECRWRIDECVFGARPGTFCFRSLSLCVLFFDKKNSKQFLWCWIFRFVFLFFLVRRLPISVLLCVIYGIPVRPFALWKIIHLIVSMSLSSICCCFLFINLLSIRVGTVERGWHILNAHNRAPRIVSARTISMMKSRVKLKCYSSSINYGRIFILCVGCHFNTHNNNNWLTQRTKGVEPSQAHRILDVSNNQSIQHNEIHISGIDTKKMCYFTFLETTD